MIKLLEHWIRHNEDHAESYRDWAQKARANGMATVGGRLEEVAKLNGSITGKFKEILKELET